MKRLLYSKFGLFTAIVCACLFTPSCSGRPSGVLSQSEMVEVLTDMHKLEGAIAEQGLMYNHDAEKEAYYNSLLEKHGISRAEFDSSVVWYTKNPKRYELVYEDVMNNLIAFEADVRKGKFHPVDSLKLQHMKINVWRKRNLYAFTPDSARTKLQLEVVNDSFLLGDTYVLRFQQRIAKSDSCLQPYVVFRINYHYSTPDSLFLPAHSDDLTRTYTLRLKAKKHTQIKSLSMTLLGSKAYRGKMNSITKVLSLTREFNELKRDSLVRIVYKADSALNAKKQKELLDSLSSLKNKVPKAFGRKLTPVQ